METVPRQRVNGAFLGNYHGKPVCLLGTIMKADGGGSAFQVKTSDGSPVNIRLKVPISEPLSGLIEIYGIGQGKNLVLAEKYTCFPEEIEQKFDMASYNEFVKFVNTTDGPDNPWKVE